MAVPHFHDLPLADRDRPWDGDAAEKRVREFTGAEDGPNADYRGELLEDGGLGDTDAFQNVVREADQASAIVFVNFDAGNWLSSLAEGDQEAAENLEPLQGFGASVWTTDEGTHGVLRLTTE